MNYKTTNSMGKTLYALEYRRGKEEGSFHYNLVYEKKFDHELLTHGYYPITVLPERVSMDASFLNLQNRLARRNAEVPEVIVEVFKWAANHPETW